MDPRKLLHFASVVECGSLTKAAKALMISQPTLSESMDRLEKSLGVKLLDRRSQGAVPTQAGETLYIHARMVRDEIERAEREIQAPDSTASQTVVFGALPSLACSVVPIALSKWRARHLGTHVSFVERMQVELLLDLVHREVDFVIGDTECYDMVDGLMQRVLFRDRLCVLARPDHPVFEEDDVSWPTLSAFPWVGALASGRYRGFLEVLLGPKGLPAPSQILQCGSVALVKSLVAVSDSLALLPAYAVHDELASEVLRCVPLDAPELHRNIVVYFRQGFIMDDQRRELISDLAAAGSMLARQPVSVSAWPIGRSTAQVDLARA